MSGPQGELLAAITLTLEKTRRRNIHDTIMFIQHLREAFYAREFGLRWHSTTVTARQLVGEKPETAEKGESAATRSEPYDTAETIIRKIDESVLDDEMYDDGEPRPPEEVIRRVKEIIRDAGRFLPGQRFPIALVRPFDGSIRITWATESGSIRLVCADDAYVFHEEVRGGRSHNPGVDQNATPESLAHWLFSLFDSR